MKSVRFNLWLFGLISVSVLFSIAMISYVADPYNLFKMDQAIRPAITSQSYLPKTVDIIRTKPDTILLGSSIVDNGFRVTGNTSMYTEHQGALTKQKNIESLIPEYLPIYNAGVRGGGLYEVYAFLQHAYLNNPHLKHVILGVELGMFTRVGPVVPMVPENFALGKTYIPPKFYLQRLFSWESIYDAYTTVLASTHGLIIMNPKRDVPESEVSNLAKILLDKMIVITGNDKKRTAYIISNSTFNKPIRIKLTSRELTELGKLPIEDSIYNANDNPVINHLLEKILSKSKIKVDNLRLVRSFYFLLHTFSEKLYSYNFLNTKPLIRNEIIPEFNWRFNGELYGRDTAESNNLFSSSHLWFSLFNSYDNVSTGFNLNPETFTCMQHIVDFAKQRNIKLDVYVSPQHAIYWASGDRFGITPYVNQWLRQLVKITPFWDFSAAIDYSAKKNTYFPSDSLHFNEDAGAIILPAILHGPKSKPANVVYVEQSNIEELINLRKQKLVEYTHSDPYIKNMFDNKFISLNKNSGHPHADLLIPLPCHSPFNSYKIFQFRNQYMALPSNQSPYDLQKIISGAYPNIVVAKSTKELIKLITSNTPVKT